MKYIALIYGDEAWFERQREEEQAAHLRAGRSTARRCRTRARCGRRGAAADGDRATVRGAGRPLVSDGPFAETKEQLCGFYVIEVDSRDEAVAWAKRCPALVHGTVELRPVLDSEDPVDSRRRRSS